MPVSEPLTLDALLDLAHARWSPYVYADTPVPEETLRALFEAARWAPSSRNEQPWRFVVAAKGDGDAHARALGALLERNRVWAHRAPVLGFACSAETFTHNGTPNKNARHDTGAAMMALGLAAAASGLALHQMGGFDAEAARAAFAIAEGFTPVVAFALGYPGETADDVPEEFARRDDHRRGRRCLADTVFSGAWAQPRWPDALVGCDDEGA
ncbi:MAG TPA: nitroreductase family protein [Rubricoccaceae bacterium]|nr:nitroreductase family protein [Rubricoccaceae bacterium]